MASTIESVAASIATRGQGRAALGRASEYLRQGYSRVVDLPSWGGTAAAAKALLDQSNAYATRVYNAIPDAALSMPLDLTTRRQVSAALVGAQEALKLIEDAAGVKYWDFPAALRVVTQGVGETAGAIAGATASAAGKAGGSFLGGVLGGLGIGWSLVAVVALAVFFVGPAGLLKLVRKVVP